MFCKYIPKSLFVIFTMFLGSCSQAPFSIQETTHQKMVLSENALSTKITIRLDQYPNDVSFKHIVFNRQQVPVTTIKTNEATVLTALIQHGEQLIENTEQTTVDEPNQLTYEYKGKIGKALLKDVAFLPTKITRVN